MPKSSQKHQQQTFWRNFFIISPALLFMFNWLWAAIYNYANLHFLNTASIPSESIQTALTYIGDHFVQLAIPILIYIFLFWFFSLQIQILVRRLVQPMRTEPMYFHPFNPGIFFMLLLSVLALVPMVMIGYHIPLVMLIKLPDFITQVLIEKSALGISALVLYGPYLLVMIKLAQTIPNLMSGQKFIPAIKQSWQTITWPHVLRFIGAVLTNLLVGALVALALYGCQKIFELVNLPAARLNANWLIFCFTAIMYGLTTWFMWQILRNLLVVPSKALYHTQSFTWRWTIGYLGVLGICGLMSVTLENGWFQPVTRTPIILSHRGVNGKNGVPNSIESLSHTIKSAHPAFVETDVQLTKDKQFVVMHDPNLKALTGVDKKPADLTLKQLTKLTMHSDGQSAKIPSLKAYLAYATKHHQRLLVELKTPFVAEKGTAHYFLTEFAKPLAANGAILHSLNKNLLTDVKKQAPQFKTGFILPYNTESLPTGNNDFYTIEYSTLDPEGVLDVHRQKKQVFAWTANDRPSMYWLSVMNVDGVITDHPSELATVLKKQSGHPHYAVALLRYFFTIQHIL